MTEERKILDGTVDFTMMYAAHDAFSRDLSRIADACLNGDAFTARTKAGWDMFAKQLHIHHTAEDTSLWPRLRAQPLQPNEVRVLDAMEMEHAELDPQLEDVEQAFTDRDAADFITAVQTLRIGLAAHMRHEENAALPLVERYLGPTGWDEFGRAIRKTQGLRAGATYLPWVLDDASPAMQSKVLALLPPPVRVLYRRVWEPRYRRTGWWAGDASL
jgi:Hemerythrin HHE cation binding domain